MKDHAQVHNKLGPLDKYYDETVWGVPMDESHSPSRKSPDGDQRSRSRRKPPDSHSSQIIDAIIQWNCPGLKNNFIEITLLVQALLPIRVYLQEYHLKRNDNITRNYSVYSTYVDEDEIAADGSAVLIR